MTDEAWVAVVSLAGIASAFVPSGTWLGRALDALCGTCEDD